MEKRYALYARTVKAAGLSFLFFMAGVRVWSLKPQAF